MNAIGTYYTQFGSLKAKITNGIKQPNKAIMLLSVMELVRCGYNKDNEIAIDDTIRIAFETTWSLFIDYDPPSVWTPFWHLNNEPFWHFMPRKFSSEIDSLVKPGQTATANQMRSVISYAYLDVELFELLKQKEVRETLCDLLIANYIKPYKDSFTNVEERPKSTLETVTK